MAILISFLNLMLYIAIIIFVAFVILWVLTSFMGIAIDANVRTFFLSDSKKSQDRLEVMPPPPPGPPSICRGC